jgi:hypothetical protein
MRQQLKMRSAPMRSSPAAWFRAVVLALSLAMLAVGVQAQKLRFGQNFDATGGLVNPGDVFELTKPNQIFAAKFSARGTLPLDTLFVVVKTIDGVAGRFYMKRNKSKTEGNALIRIKAEGIYRVYIYNPQRRSRPVAATNLFITGPILKTKAELIERQRRILVARGVIKDAKPDTSAPAGAQAEADDEDELGDLDDEEEEGLDDEEDLDELDELDELLGDEEFFDEDDLLGEFEDLDDLEEELDVDLEDFN